MELKRFKNFRSNVINTYVAENGRVQVKMIKDSYVVCINDIQVEEFLTLEAAEEVASIAVESLGNLKQ